MIKPLKFRHLTLPNNIVQAPLAGYSSAPFRMLFAKYSQPGFAATEMISAKNLIHRKVLPKRYLYKDKVENVTCYQLAANDTQILAQACEIVSNAGADIIDLNCGCPVSKIRAKGTGSKLLVSPEKIFDLVSTMRKYSDAVVSVKIRVSGNVGDHDDEKVIAAAQAAGVDFITVHGRHWSERYDVPVSLTAIKHIVDIAKVPVFANGDVKDFESFKTTMEQTGAAGVMIGRASVGQPWLFKEICSQYENKVFTKPDNHEVAQLFIEHIEKAIELDCEKQAVLQSRKFAKYYGRSLENKLAFVIAMQDATTLHQAKDFIYNYFDLNSSSRSGALSKVHEIV